MHCSAQIPDVNPGGPGAGRRSTHEVPQTSLNNLQRLGFERERLPVPTLDLSPARIYNIA